MKIKTVSISYAIGIGLLMIWSCQGIKTSSNGDNKVEEDGQINTIDAESSSVPGSDAENQAANGGSDGNGESEATAAGNDAPIPYVEELVLKSTPEIFDSLSLATGVPLDTPVIQQALLDNQNQCPQFTYKVSSFDTVQQKCLVKVAFAFCNFQIDSADLSSAAYPGFNFDTPAAQLAQADKDSLINALTAKYIADEGNTPNERKVALQNLLDEFIGSNFETPAIAKALCTASYASTYFYTR